GFAVWNRNKQSVVVDPCSPRGQRRLTALLADADLCIYTDPASLDETAAANPTLVRLHTPPYAPDGTPWAGRAEPPELLAAAAHANRRRPGRPQPHLQHLPLPGRPMALHGRPDAQVPDQRLQGARRGRPPRRPADRRPAQPTAPAGAPRLGPRAARPLLRHPP